MFGPLGALEHFFDYPRPDTAKINGCRCGVYGRYLLSFIRDDLHHHFFGSFFTLDVRGLKIIKSYYYICGLDSVYVILF